MKICNFRPLVCLALIAVVTIGTAMLSLSAAVIVAITLFLFLWFCHLPHEFKIVAMAVCAAVMISYMLTTALVPNPYQRTYDPNSGLRGVVLGYVRWYLPMFLSQDNADILYAMLFGDKSVLAWGVRQDFNVAGLAHVLAVSGFHVDLLYFVTCAILKWCRVPKRAHLWVVTPLLLFYGYLCGWRYAVLRAVIMSLIYAVAKRHLHVADPLSVLSLSAVIILIIFPYALVSASFLLSFSCLLGIYFWFDALHRKIPVKSIAMYLSVTFGSFPFFVYFFGGELIFGVVSSVALVPLLVVSFYCGMFAVVTSIGGAVLYLAEPLLSLVRWVANGMARLPCSIIPIKQNIPAILVYLLAAMILSRFVFLKPKTKYVLSAVLFTCYLVLLVV